MSLVGVHLFALAAVGALCCGGLAALLQRERTECPPQSLVPVRSCPFFENEPGDWAPLDRRGILSRVTSEPKVLHEGRSCLPSARCGAKSDAYIVVGKDLVYACDFCRVKWSGGKYPFSKVPQITPEEQARNDTRLAKYAEVSTSAPPAADESPSGAPVPEGAERIASAIVTLPRLSGRGVLIASRRHDWLIVTAAHCIELTTSGEMTQCPDDFREEVRAAADGKSFSVAVIAVEPIADIAVLGSVDGYRSPREAEAFEEFCEITSPVPLCADIQPGSQPLFAYTLDHRWIRVRGNIPYARSPRVGIRAPEEIGSGVSGGPIVTPDGRLLALVSTCSSSAEDVSPGPYPFDGISPVVVNAVPLWLSGLLAQVECP